MLKHPITINKKDLLNKANELIRQHPDYIEGMCANSVRQENGVLVFGGEYFLDNNGLPTTKSTAAFNMFKYLAHYFSEQYCLID